MEHLTMDQVKEAILDYVKEHPYNYALLIDGEWGCGKTYFIKNTVIQEIEKIKIETSEQGNNRDENGKRHKKKPETIDETKKVIYVSLYGARSTDDISLQILYAWMSISKKAGDRDAKEALPKIKTAAELVEIFFGRSGFTAKLGEGISHFISDWDKYVLIFDDLERTHLPINVVFGFINQFVEQNGAKVILIANEKEIGSVVMEKGLEQKYLVCLNDNIQYTDFSDAFIQGTNESDTELDDQKNENTSSEKVTVDDLNKRVDHVFGELDQYKKIKEKLIGQTIFFNPDLEKLIRQINSKAEDAIVHDSTVRDTIEEAVPMMVNIMQRENHYNLRTYQFAMAFFAKVLKLLNSEKIDYQNVGFATVLIKAVLLATIVYKKGEPPFDWSYEAEYGELTRHGQTVWAESYTSFKFICDYIYYSAYDSSRIKTVIKDYLDDKRLEALHWASAFNKLQAYWNMEDDDIEEQLKGLKNEISEDDLFYIERYPLILSLLYQLKEIGFEINVDEYVDLMVETIRKHGAASIFRIQADIRKNNKQKKEIRINLDRLYAASEEMENTSYRSQLNKTLENKNGWGESLNIYCMQNKNGTYDLGRFLSLVDIELLIDRINSGNTKDLYDFYSCLNSLNSRTGHLKYVEVGDKLYKLYNAISEMSIEGRNKGNIRKATVNIIQRYILKTGRIVELTNEDSTGSQEYPPHPPTI